jgi:hypothetical protein
VTPQGVFAAHCETKGFSRASVTAAPTGEQPSIQMTADTYGHLFPRGDDGAEMAAAEKAFLG